MIATLETLAANALPAKHADTLDGWRLRYNDGVTRRANSVLAEKVGVLPLEEKLERSETFYRNLSAPARFQISPASQPENLDDVLEARGYRFEAGADVQLASVKRVTDAVAKRISPNDEPLLLPSPNAGWLRVYEAVEGRSELRRAMFAELGAEAVFALVQLDNEPAAVGVGVYEAGFVGIFNMATHPSFRRRGAATKVLAALAQWAKAKDAKQLYLQVASHNEKARAAYERAGFTTRYHYHYRTKDVSKRVGKSKVEGLKSCSKRKKEVFRSVLRSQF